MFRANCGGEWSARTVVLLAALWASVGAVSWGAEVSKSELPKPQMTYLDNGEVRIGMDLALGGAVTFLASVNDIDSVYSGNLINSADLGRQIQMSHYSGPVPFVVGDKQPAPHWAGLGWNPIQTGDCKMNPSKVVEHRNDGREIYIRCIPMQWPMDNVPGDCVFETWTTLDGPVIRMRFRCTNAREDKSAYPPTAQELPAVYTISRLDQLMTYAGERPFTGDALARIENNWREGWPWTKFTATERWAALVDASGFGVGVFKNDGGEFHGGIYGDERSDDPRHWTTGYVAPVHRENFDHNIVYEHETVLMVGQLDEMRKRFNELATKGSPRWVFASDRQHWTLRDARDEGLPLNGEWRIFFGEAIPKLESPTQCWRAEDASRVTIEAAWSGAPTRARIYWRRLDDAKYDKKKSVVVELASAGEMGDEIVGYRVDLSESAEYRGLITGLRLELIEAPRPGEGISIREIRLD